MKLYITRTSPYVRKVRVVVRELGLAGTIEEIEFPPGQVPPAIAKDNPLGKVPTLVLQDGRAIFDSPVICEFLDATLGQHRLLPRAGESRWADLVLQALADGIMDAVVANLIESRRPPATQLPEIGDKQIGKVKEATAALAALVDGFGDEPSLGQLAAAVALGYVDFRLASFAWRDAHPALALWHARLLTRPSFVDTAPPV